MVIFKAKKNSYLEFLSRRCEKSIKVYQTFPYGGDKLRYRLKLTLEVYEKLFVSLDTMIAKKQRKNL